MEYPSQFSCTDIESLNMSQGCIWPFRKPHWHDDQVLINRSRRIGNDGLVGGGLAKAGFETDAPILTKGKDGRSGKGIYSIQRSEERRVGKECRSRWSRYQ